MGMQAGGERGASAQLTMLQIPESETFKNKLKSFMSDFSSERLLRLPMFLLNFPLWKRSGWKTAFLLNTNYRPASLQPSHVYFTRLWCRELK